MTTNTLILTDLRRSATGLFRTIVIAFATGIPVKAMAQEDRIWENLGPRVITSGGVAGITDGEVVGAVNSVAPHPSNPDVMFIGAVNGGVWRTSNATSTAPVWEDVSGDLPSFSIGAVAYDVNDAGFQTILVGAGLYSSFARRGGFPQFGIYRTTNAGDDWSDIDGGALDGQSINAIAPNGNLILVSVLNRSGGTALEGVHLGQNSGGVWTWTQLSGRVPPGQVNPVLTSGSTFDLVADPVNAGQYYTMNQNGVYRVTLPATNPENVAWTRVSSNAMDTQLSGASHGRLAIGPGGEVFVAMSTPGTVLSNFWRSADGSTGWANLDTPITNGFGNWFLALAADPANGNVAYVGGGGNSSNFRVDASLASGTQATTITGATGTASGSRPHADVRDLRFDANGDLIEADDGGVYRQTSPTDATGDWLSVNGNLAITEIHNVSWDAVSHVAIGGVQDNGTNIQNDFVRDRWLRIQGGDGGDTAVNDTGSAVQSQRYTSLNNLGSFTRRAYDQDNNPLGTNPAPMIPPAGVAPVSAAFTTPYAVNVVNPLRIVVGGTNGIYESLDQGQNSVRLQDGTGAAVPGANSSGWQDPIAVGANGNADALYVGIGDDVWVRTAGGFGGALTQTDPSATRSNEIADVVIDPADDQTAFAFDDGGAVFWTNNAGANWTDITGNLGAATSAALRSIAYSTSNTSGAVIVGTDNGAFIARGDGSSVNDGGGSPIPFTDWATLGVGLPPVPVYDLEYDPTDEVLVAGTLGRGAWAVNMEERNAIDAVLVLDKSGSMGGPAAPGAESKMVVLQDAAELFIQTWQMLSDADDRIAAVFFDSSIEAFSDSSSNELVTLTSSGDDVINYIRSKTNGGWTAMGGGTQTAINLLLADNSRPRSLIVFTDGMQNLDPMIDLQGGVYEIRNTGIDGSGVSPTTPPTRLNDALDITVNTIGVGVSAAYEAELAAISSGTSGLHKSTTNADADLRRFYIEQLVDVLRDSSPQLIDYGYSRIGSGGSDARSFRINVGAKKVVFSISWDRRDAKRLSIEIFKDGENITRLSDETRSDDFYELISFDTSAALSAAPIDSALSSDGRWEVRVRGLAAVDYEVAVLADDSVLNYQFQAVPGLMTAGETTVLAGEVKVNGLPHGDGVSIRVEIEHPQENLDTVLSRTPTPPGIEPRDGESPAEAKLRHLLLTSEEFRQRIAKRRTTKTLVRTAAGRFSVPFAETSVAGVYRMSFLLDGTGTLTGEFERREQYYLIVVPGPFATGSSEIKTIDVSNADGKTTTTVRILPQDIHGNYLGADQQDDVRGIATEGGTSGVVADVGNGWYELVFTTDEVEPVIEISIGDVVVATGKPTEIDVHERPPIVTGRPPIGGETGDDRVPPRVDRRCWPCYVIACVLFVLVLLLTIRAMKKAPTA